MSRVQDLLVFGILMTPIMENHMEKNMKIEIESGLCIGNIRVLLGL